MLISKQEKLLHKIVQKTWEDRSFKENLLQSPTSAIENFIVHKLAIP